MSTEQLPDGLRLAGVDGPFNACMYRDDCRAERHQRLTLQNHAADQAQRIADLETKCGTLKELHDAVADERDALRTKVYDLQRSAVNRREISDGVEAELVDECETLRTLKSMAESERDALREQINACTPHLRERLDGGLESPADMLAMREREVLGLLGRLSDAQMQGDALRARLAEIEAQEPVGWQQRTLFDGQWSDWQGCNWRTANILRQREDYEVRGVYARPIPAQAVPDKWQLVPVEPTPEMARAGHYRYCAEFVKDYKLMIAAAPEQKA